MAKCKKQSSVLLGYEDELITEKHKSSIGYWTNKIGGCPDYPVEGIMHPKCQLCDLVQPLIVQIYAPLENSPFHRTLYVFGCINPNCWNQNESWTCLRSQIIDSEYEGNVSNKPDVKTNVDWCTGADNWDDDNGNFENGNVITQKSYQSDNESDDSSSLSAGIGNLTVDECNANWGAFGHVDKDFGAVGKQMSPIATAEIEGDESEVVSIDTPTIPQRDLLALLQETAPLPYCLHSSERNQNNSLSFISMFMSVGEELSSSSSYSSDHIRELIQQYQQQHGDVLPQTMNQGGDGYEPVTEKYEKSTPAHGDKMFHQFLSRIHLNPGQILRYSRETGFPLLLYPIQDSPRKCRHCSGDLVFEMQILPTIIPKLRFPEEDETHIEFGTVLVFTCKRSCWASGDTFKTEAVLVQMERLASRIKLRRAKSFVTGSFVEGKPQRMPPSSNDRLWNRGNGTCPFSRFNKNIVTSLTGYLNSLNFVFYIVF